MAHRAGGRIRALGRPDRGCRSARRITGRPSVSDQAAHGLGDSMCPSHESRHSISRERDGGTEAHHFGLDLGVLAKGASHRSSAPEPAPADPTRIATSAFWS